MRATSNNKADVASARPHRHTVLDVKERLVQPPGRIVGGQAVVEGTDLLALNERELREVRWNQVALIPQGAMNSLNPVMRVKDQIADAIKTHQHPQDPGV